MYQDATIADLGHVIANDWRKPYFGAVPYIDAMQEIGVRDPRGAAYYADRADDIVAYFLANAGSWRGDTARAVKAELKKRIGR